MIDSKGYREDSAEPAPIAEYGPPDEIVWEGWLVLPARPDRAPNDPDYSSVLTPPSADGADGDDENWVSAFGNDVLLPSDIRPEAFHGPIGEFAQQVGGVRTMAPPIALLAIGLAAFGSRCGRGTWRTYHEVPTYPMTFPLLVGTTGSGKGIGHRVTCRWLEAMDDHTAAAIVSDFSSGEGLIQRLVKVAPDPVLGDTRAFAWTEEFAGVLRAKNRDGSILGQVLRRAFDGDRLERNTVRSNGSVDAPALSLVAHVTPEELRAEASMLDAASGFLNRFLLVPVSPVAVPRTPPLPEDAYRDLARRLSDSVKVARSHRGPALVTPEAHVLLDRVDEWRMATRGRPGLVGRMGERIPQNVGRLSVAYALSRLDPETPTPTIDEADVLAALALCDISERTMLALWCDAPAEAETARMVHRVRVAGSEGISTRDLLKGLYSAANRSRGRNLLARALDAGALTKEKSGRGWRILPGTSATRPSLWDSCARATESSPIVRGPSPMSPIGGTPIGGHGGRDDHDGGTSVGMRAGAGIPPRTSATAGTEVRGDAVEDITEQPPTCGACGTPMRRVGESPWVCTSPGHGIHRVPIADDQPPVDEEDVSQDIDDEPHVADESGMIL